MSSASSASSRNANRRGVYGVPTRCWCGQNLKTFVSKTNENPYRRFYRCVVASQRETENHLFKWEDEALLDETRLVDAKRLDLVHDLQTLSNTVRGDLAAQEARLGELRHELEVKFLKITQEIESKQDAPDTSPQHSALNNIAVSVAVIGAMAWFYFKLS
ncbi:hypothetical protein Bca101_020166 [Brassica carinata]